MPKLKDEVQVSFEVGMRDGGRVWTLKVSCPEPLDEKEFGASLRSLSDDILQGLVSFETAPDVLPRTSGDPDPNGN